MWMIESRNLEEIGVELNIMARDSGRPHFIVIDHQITTIDHP
jgi:hypothetical protein